ncbi:MULTISPECIES: ATP-binding protein [unclassified Streptomyces]|uniref:ATP-binding protein n=1 Tax=Streptomyces evansiae TaxID=3075535 RepID=A0ABD5EAX5_9ACTN|nr:MULTISPECIES: ATP-binding protein [unclassified Streptomyces]EGJ75686.1 putative carbon monoxide dehydrogenase accessory protein [Streptomyces sp. Tu6071]MDT0413145.1 ATP-binding protein [Streptomyces sp. DSM 41979]MDT0417793.1 ATP-binding protein [Streptomyces sp. DSM 41982]MYQ55776.1 ATP-binding protein [Streptomyces sp. SID4926]SCE08580.1 CO dehydrogenase maturation factor [Streptomyces sp. SolWspMP-sol7th]
MKIAFVGKGGSGKTTLAALFVRHLARTGAPVLAVDADINQHLGVALGLAEEEAAQLPAMGVRLPLIKEYLRGSNPRIASVDTMIKTTPPGAGSRLLRVAEANPVHDACARRVELDGADARLMVTGAFTEADLGVACYHSKVGAVELYLNHLVDGRDEYVVVDMTAGADSFASGLFTRFDMTFLVAEPTRRGVSVYRQYKEYARDFGVALRVVGNKVDEPDDLAFLRDEVGEDLLVTVGRSGWVRAMEKGRSAPFGELEEENRAALASLQGCADATYTRRDWERYTRQMVHFHLKNARSWGNDRTGANLASQVDPDFVLDESGRKRSPGGLRHVLDQDAMTDAV